MLEKGLKKKAIQPQWRTNHIYKNGLNQQWVRIRT